MKQPLKVLFLCTGNSCRSIIAEALANDLGAGRLIARSAGSHPTGQVNPHALAVLEKHGIAVDAPASKSMDDLQNEGFDAVITVCDAAAGEACPVWLADVSKAHWGIPDPAGVDGDDGEIEAAFESTYQRLRERIETLLAEDLDGLTPLSLTVRLRKIHEDAALRA